jgi:hypothetical protein
MVVTKFLQHKDHCVLPDEDEFVKVGGRVGIVVDCNVEDRRYPEFEVQMPSGRTSLFPASQIARMPNQEEGRRVFFE